MFERSIKFLCYVDYSLLKQQFSFQHTERELVHRVNALTSCDGLAICLNWSDSLALIILFMYFLSLTTANTCFICNLECWNYLNSNLIINSSLSLLAQRRHAQTYSVKEYYQNYLLCDEIINVAYHSIIFLLQYEQMDLLQLYPLLMLIKLFHYFHSQLVTANDDG